MNNQQLVSIVVPIFNMGDKIEHCIQSVLQQDYENIEILLVDDGSKDNSLSVCKALAEKSSKINVIHTENCGSGPARNTGIAHSKGGYVYFPDADDYMEPNTISTLVDAMNNGIYDLVVFGYKNVNTKGDLVSIKEFPDIVKNGDEIRFSYADYMTAASSYAIQGAPWNKFFKMSIIKEHDIKYPSLRRHQDEGFIGRYMCHVKSVHFIKDILYTYYTNDLKREWMKYPVDYIDAVIGLNEVRKETILKWNEKDSLTHEMIRREFICNVIKSLELSFSPKMNLRFKGRIAWIKDVIRRTRIIEIPVPSILGEYQKIILIIMKFFPMILLYEALHVKVIFENAGRK